MKISNIVVMIAACLAGMLSCTKLDNYDDPNGAIYGKLIDSVTGQPLLTEEPNGFRIRYIEQDYINPNVAVQNFYGKADGTFERALLFAASYKVIPIEGAFFPRTDTVLVTVPGNGRAEVNFTVCPYLNLMANAHAVGNSIVVKYSISRARQGDKIAVRRALCSQIPTVDNNVWYKDVTTSVTSIPDATILSTAYSDTIKGLSAGKTYNVRAAARTNNANSRFNYSPVFTINIP